MLRAALLTEQCEINKNGAEFDITRCLLCNNILISDLVNIRISYLGNVYLSDHGNAYVSYNCCE